MFYKTYNYFQYTNYDKLLEFFNIICYSLDKERHLLQQMPPNMEFPIPKDGCSQMKALSLWTLPIL